MEFQNQRADTDSNSRSDRKGIRALSVARTLFSLRGARHAVGEDLASFSRVISVTFDREGL